jgi:tripartite-type tricarboxylate transporter receptor subunit TctC
MMRKACLPSSVLAIAVQCLVALVVFGSTGALAQQESYPSRPIRLIVTFGAGGIADVVARYVAVPLGEAIGQPVVVENRPGAGGSIGAQFVAKSPPDGYTLLVGTLPTQVVNPLIYSQVGYDPWKDLVPVSLIAGAPFILVMGPIPGVTDLPSLVAYARANPGKLNYGSAGAGGHPHLGMELFKMSTQTDIVHVPYKSGAESVGAVLSGQVQLAMDALPVLGPHIKAGRVTALAISTPERSPAIPEVKTGVEQGLTGFRMNPAWFGIAAPAGTPPDRIDKLSAAIAKVFADPAVAARFAELGLITLPLGPASYAKLLQEEADVWGRVIRTAKIKLD